MLKALFEAEDVRNPAEAEDVKNPATESWRKNY